MNSLFSLLLLMFALTTYGQKQELQVFFDVNKYQLSEDAMKQLLQITKNDQIENMEIIGYADTTGPVVSNNELSDKRAKSVESFLLENGVDQTRIKKTSGVGESTNFQKLAKNRNVTITYELVPKKEDLPIVDKEPVQSRPDEDKEVQEQKIADHKSRTRDGALDQSTIESLEVGEILNLGGIEFQPGRHMLTKRSYKSVDKLMKIMKDNPNLRIEIQGHICCNTNRDGLDKDTGTMNLSENRAISIYTELIKAGIDKQRLSYKGYGPFRKLVKEVDDNSRQRNRRVSIQVLEK